MTDDINSNPERTDREEEALAAKFSRKVLLQLLQAREASDRVWVVHSRALIKGAVDEDYRFTDDELDRLENINPDLRTEYERLTKEESIDYDGPSLDEMMNNDN